MPSGLSPKDDGFQHLSLTEEVCRGPYYGLVGMIYPDGTVDFAQVLRTIFNSAQGAPYIYAGANISAATLKHWTAKDEVEEVRHKLSTVKIPYS
jgi:anthranilate/para-aminobenzoate synthase component I